MTIDELLNNDKFVSWVVTKDPGLDIYWNEWLRNNPSLSDVFYAAKDVVIKIAEANRPVYGSTELRLWQKIQKTVFDDDTRLETTTSFSAFKKWKWVAAAVVMMLVGAGVFYQWSRNSVKKSTNIAQSNTGTEIPAQVLADSTFIERINSSKKTKTVHLPDGSKIVLEPGSSIRHQALFNKERREVYLNGDAFFEVAKNATRPFYVYADGVVTKVLGTSFRVKSLGKNEGVLVAVRTGKVTVSSLGEDKNESRNQTVLLPNQQVIFTDKDISVKSAVNDVQLITTQETNQEDFTFDNVRVAAILAKLSKIYSVHLIYDEAVYANCYLTTSLDNESLYDKLNIVCKAIGAHYTIKNNSIEISGSDCR